MCNKLCRTEKVVLDGKEIILRNPKMTDVRSLQNFINSFVEEVGTIGILVKKNYRGIELGKLLMKKITDLIKKDPEIKVLTLGVFPLNKVAMNLYKKLRFKTVAKLPKRHLYKGKYVDEYVMDYPLKKI